MHSTQVSTRFCESNEGQERKSYRSEKWAEPEQRHGLSAFFLSVEVCDGTPANRHRRCCSNTAHKTKHHEHGCVGAKRTTNGKGEVYTVSHVVYYQPSVDLRQRADEQGIQSKAEDVDGDG